MSPRRELRLSLGLGALLTEGEAVDLLPMAGNEARAWLRSESLIRDLAGRSVVVWREVLERLERQAVQPSRAPNRGKVATLRRARLDPL